MRKILLFAVAFMMSVAMMAIGKGDGTSKANAIDFDWANGHKPALSAGSWYRVSLSHMKAEANDPTLALYLTNLTDVKASVTVVVEASIDVPLVGTQSGSKTATYSIAGKDYALWSLQSINTSKGSFSLKQLMEYDLKEVYLQLTANKEIALSAKVYETEDIVDDACTKAIDFDWNGAAVPAGERWYRLDLADVKTNGNELKFVVANNGAKEAHVSFDMSLDCPASAVIEKDWVIAAGAEQKEDFGRVFLDFLNEDYIFVKLTTDQPLTFSVEEEVIVVDPSKPNPYEDFTCATAAELIFDEEMQLTAGKHVYKVKRAELIAERDFDTEFRVTNQSGVTANLAVEVAFACPVKSVVTQNLEIGAHESIMKLVKGDMLKAVNSEWVYIRFITDQDLTATVGMRNVSPCATAVPFDWTTGADLAAGESQWYVVDITSLKQNKQHLTLNFTNHSDIQALVNVEVALDCEGTKLPMILPIPAGMNFGQTIDYQLLKKAPLPRIYVSVSTNAHIELASSVKSAIASDLTPCLNAINPEHGVEYTQKANTTQWYKLSLDLLESTADYSSIYLASKGNSTAHVTIGVVTDCQYTTGTKVTIPVPAGISFGVLAPNVLGKLLKELARFENTYNKVDSKDLYLEIETDQPLGFGLDVVNAATNPCLRSDLITFDWNKGASVEKGDMKWFDMDIDAVKAAGKHVKLTFTNPTDSLVWAATMVSVECPAKLTMPLLVPVPAGMSVDKWINYQLFAVADIHNIYIGVLTDGALELKAESVDATIVPPADCLAAKKIVSGEEYVQDPGTQWYQFPMSLIDEMGGAMKLSLKNLSNNHATLTAGVTVGCEYAATTLVKAVAPKGIEGSLYMPKSIISKVRGLIDPAITDFYVQLTTDEKIAFSLINQATGANACSGAVDFDWTAWENNGFALEANKAQWYKVDIREPLKKLQNGEDITIGLTNPNPMEVEVDLAVSPTCPIVLSLEKSITVPSGTSAGVTITYDQVVQLVEKLDKYDLAQYDYKAMLKKVNVYMLYQKLDQELTERGYDEYVPLERIEPIINRYGEAASLVNAKKFLENYETYLSVEELKKRLAPYKEQVSLETVIGLLNKYGGDKIPKIEAEEILSNPMLLPYIGTVQTITDKCKQYITKENLKDLVERVKARVPFEEIKQLCKRIEDKLQQYLPDPYTFYVYVKASGELVINPEIPVAPECDGVVMADTIVACDSYEWRGVTYTETGIYRDSISATNPEDAEFLNWKQTVKLSEFAEPWYKLDVSDIIANKLDFTLQLENDLNTTLAYTLELYDCYNEIILSGTKNVTSGGISYTVSYDDFAQYTDGLDCDVLYLRNVNYDCDKLYELNLTINKSKEVVYTVDTCGTYEWNGKTYTAPFAGSDTVVLQTATGCDSIEILNLTLTECPVECTPVAVDTTIVACDSAVWNGVTYTISGDYVDSLQTVNGCDSIVTLHLTINNSITKDTTVTACGSYEWNGQTYTVSNDYTYTTTAANGCDSVVTLHLTINQPVDTIVKDTICGGEMYKGELYLSDTILTITETTVNGCDSVVTLELTVLPLVEVDTTICVGETFNGVQYNAVGYEEVIIQYQNVACDSAIYYLNIEDCPLPPTPCTPVYHEFTATFCTSYTWNGVVYDKAGDYVQIFHLANDCDSIVTLHLVEDCATPCVPVHTEFDATFCGEYNWNGTIYTTAGDYEQTLTDANGCDSIVTMHLTENCPVTPDCDDVETEFTTTFCGSFTWNGVVYTQEGDYVQTLSKTDGCDSIVTLHLVEECPVVPELPENPCLNAIDFDWLKGAYLTAGDAQWYEMNITSLVENKQHVTLTFTNHSNTTAWVHAVVALDCEGIIVPMLLPVPAGLSVSQTIDYQLLVRSPLRRIYVGVYSENADIELQSSVKDAIADDQTPCLNATEVQYNVLYVNEPGTSWYKISTELLKNQSDLTGFYFANKGNARAHATIGMVPNCQYTTGTTITLPIPAGFEFNVMAPNILGQLMQELEGFEEAFNNWDVKDIYMALTTDETVEFELSTRDINQACETATEIDWKEWETNGLQLKANQDEWYAFNLDYLLERLLNDKEISIAVSNLDTVAVDVEMSFSPTCPVLVTLDRSFTIPAKTAAKKTFSTDDVLQLLSQYEKYVPYEQIKLFVEKYEDRFSVAELKDMLENYEKYVSVAQLKQELAKHKEYISYETIAAVLDKYGEYIPYDEAKTLLDKYEPYLTIYAGGVAVLLDKCEPYITMENFKKVVAYCKQYIPYEELKQLFTNFKNYITNGYRCYLRVKTTGDLYAGPKPLPIPCEDVVEEMTVATCDAYEWKGVTYTESGDYTFTKPLANPAEADLLDWTQPIKLSEFTAPWYKLDVSNVIANKTEFNLTLENDYDSTLTITLALYDNPTDDYMVSISKDVEPGVYSRTFTYEEFENSIGVGYDVLYLRNVNFDCEHVEILHLTVNKSVEKEYDVEACDAYTWHGNTYTTSGDYTFNDTTAEGCDLTEILHLTIIQCEEDTVPTKNVTITDLVCDGTEYVDSITGEKHIISSLIPTTQTWTDLVETADTIYTYNFIITPIVAPVLLDDATLARIPGATPVLTQGLVPDVTGTTEAIKAYYEANDADNLADVTAVYWDAASLTVQVVCGAVSHTMNLVVETDCDNVLKTSHTFDVPALVGIEEEAIICYGETYLWNGKIYAKSGIYRDTIIGVTGCDSIATLNLTVLPEIAETVEETIICYGETYVWPVDGKTYAANGRYSVTLQDVNGCDSVVTLALTVLPEVPVTEEKATICYGETYTWAADGKTYSSDGIYTVTLSDVNGCDSVVTLALTVLPEVADTEETKTLCYGETYDWNGQTYDASGDYSVTLQDANGCDYTATLHLIILDEITLPNVTADDITAVCGKAIDVTAANAIIQAHIAAYDWVEDVVWEVLVDGKWEALTNTAIDGKAEIVTVRYTIQTACEDLTNTLTVTVEMPNPENDESLANVPAYNKYGGRLLTVDLKYIKDEFGWNVAEEDVTWYLVVEGGNDLVQGTGYYLTTEDGTPLPAGSYYALIEHSAVSESDCDVLLQTVILIVETQVGPMLAPTVVKPQELIKLMNLDPNAVSTVRMYSTTGELMDTFQVTDKKETSFHAAHIAGYYIVDVQTETEKVSLRYIVK